MKAKFHLPDFTTNFHVNYLMIEMLEQLPQYFYDDVEIASVFGVFPPSLWNGGRVRHGRCTVDYMKQVLQAINGKGIPLRFTFTNPLLEEKHLKDEFCNTVMKMANNGLNEVIVASPLLEEYIRRKYPKYRITSSTCKRLNDPEKAAAELEKDYHLVVLDYDLNNKFDVLEQLPHKEKCELLVNAVCNPECAFRAEHYRVVGGRQLAYGEHIRRFGKDPKAAFNAENHPEYAEFFDTFADSCNCEHRTLFQIKGLKTHISPEAIREQYMPMGFSQFKLEGRNLELLNIVEQYMYYMAKPEARDEARFLFLCQLAKRGIIKLPF